MLHIFQTIDKSGRNIHLSKEGWAHINEEHPEVSGYLEEIQETLKNPIKIKEVDYDEDIRYYYRYYKSIESPAKNLLVIVKYLNGEGFIITAYFVKSIK
ncbi:hypothetical protein HYW19_03785 [Candidatus Woesearchaeota archaeon]|nr:hypothetical protein [Candidatus Woesearchaeota archaeon]